MTTRTTSLFLALAAALAAGGAAQAHDYEAPGLKIQHPWSRPANAGGTGAGFVTIVNTERTPVTLVSITTPRAQRVEFHRTVESQGVFSMEKQEGGLTIAPGGNLVLAPGGVHAMLIGLTERNANGQNFPAVMTFRRDGQTSTVRVEFSVQISPPEPAGREHRH